MAFAGSQYVDASQGVLTDISGSQNTVNVHYNCTCSLILVLKASSCHSQPAALQIPMVSFTACIFFHISLIYNDLHTAAKTVSYLPMPFHNELFTGRDAHLKTLEEYFRPRSTSYPSRRFLVHGIGGAGKTQMCARFAEQISNR